MAEMATEQTPIVISPDSELGIALKRASTEHEPVAIRIGGESYQVDVFESHPATDDEQYEVHSNDDAGCAESRESRDPLLEVLGIFASGEPNNDVAQDKYRYLAEAYLSERK